MEYNLQHSDKVHKYTINIPHDLFQELEIKSKHAGFEEIAPYLRAVIAKEVKTGTLCLQEILGGKEFSRREFVSKTEVEHFKKQSWIEIKISKISNIINPKQYSFKWDE